jgi:ER lumen protein retaining receptor
MRHVHVGVCGCVLVATTLCSCWYTPGISFKTQVLYVVVFLTRYLDMFLGDWISLYNTSMKLFFIGSSAYILYLMKVRFRYVYLWSTCSVTLKNLSHIQAHKRPVHRHLPRGIRRGPMSSPQPNLQPWIHSY